jgi:S-adenosylmethionine:tRNA ribosyltransferase-isomerase
VRASDFDYVLPAELIAQIPVTRRDGSRLMLLTADGSQPTDQPVSRPPSAVSHRRFLDFPSLINPGDVVVLNDSRVIPARLRAARRGGGGAEVLLVTREADGAWRALVKPGARIRVGAVLTLSDGDTVEIVEHLATGERRVRLAGEGGSDAVLARHGTIPLPPYITRDATDLDRERYQTIYADAPGSVAAPTAGLHFTAELLAAIEARGGAIARVTLHVGPGTFRPVSGEDVASHHMDAEAYSVPEAAAALINRRKTKGGRVWAVGTTALRTLESVAREDGTIAGGTGWTRLFITPGYRFRAADALLTNFHLPRSTLLMLVCAFAGTERTLAAYREAVAQRYRFYSYGDAMAIV